jgi:hypothetical protein
MRPQIQETCLQLKSSFLIVFQSVAWQYIVCVIAAKVLDMTGFYFFDTGEGICSAHKNKVNKLK